MKIFKKGKRENKYRLNIKRIAIAILLIALLLSLLGSIEIGRRAINTKLENSQTKMEEKITNKDKIIEILEQQINELKTKQENLEKRNQELENEIEKIKISKINKKTTVTSRSGSSLNKTTVSNEKWIWANVSAYCSCTKCCGKTNGITASGVKAIANHTIAAPSNYNFGTKIELEGMGTYTVEDRGGAITGNKIDVYFNSHSEALKFGRKQIKMRIVQ